MSPGPHTSIMEDRRRERDVTKVAKWIRGVIAARRNAKTAGQQAVAARPRTAVLPPEDITRIAKDINRRHGRVLEELKKY